MSLWCVYLITGAVLPLPEKIMALIDVLIELAIVNMVMSLYIP
jgi:hypothetical protein